jgi:protein-S-isoprenylcysteine O-methyltransferase Ste14
MKIAVVLILLATFIIQRIIWSMSDPRSLKQRLSWIKVPIHLITGTITMGSGILAIILYMKDYYLITEFETMVSIVGLILAIGGSAFAAWARLYMGKFWLPANEGHNIQKQNKLHTGGPFKYSRNPIYAGLIISAFGFYLALNSYLIVTIGLIYWYFNKSIKAEEPLLEKHFGEKYETYMKKTPRLLLIKS